VLTFFTTAKPFEGHAGIIQRNALKSWKLVHPDVEVILFGDEPGTAEVCQEMGLRHEAHVERHESGMKYLDYMFSRAQQIARHSRLCYSNCDIVLMNDFRDALERVSVKKREFLLVGQRRDTDVTTALDFDNVLWEQELRRYAIATGVLQIRDFVDFFVFPKGLFDHVPRFVVGRSYWDHWLVWKALAARVPVVDGTEFFVAVHQNHGYGYHPQGKQGTNEDALAMQNRALAGKGRELRSLMDVTHKLTRWGAIRRVFLRRQLNHPHALATQQFVLEKTFRIRKRLGLRRQTFINLAEKTIHRTSGESDRRKIV
jgi:hypothetical protein